MKGFTLFELMVVIGIMIILLVTALPMGQYFRTFSGVSSAKEELIGNLRLAETRAKAGLNNSAHGVFLNGNDYTIYEGSSFASRNQAKDITKALPGDITATGVEAATQAVMNDINFVVTTGNPVAIGIITLNSQKTNTNRTITINSLGLIE